MQFIVHAKSLWTKERHLNGTEAMCRFISTSCSILTMQSILWGSPRLPAVFFLYLYIVEQMNLTPSGIWKLYYQRWLVKVQNSLIDILSDFFWFPVDATQGSRAFEVLP